MLLDVLFWGSRKGWLWGRRAGLEQEVRVGELREWRAWERGERRGDAKGIGARKGWGKVFKRRVGSREVISFKNRKRKRGRGELVPFVIRRTSRG